MINKAAIQHRPLSDDAYLDAEGKLNVRLRAAHGDLREVELLYGDRVYPSDPMPVTEVELEKLGSDGIWDLYECRIESDLTRICYYFRLKGMDGEALYFSERGFESTIHSDRTQYFQYPYLRREDLPDIPDWARDIVMYHIFPDSFASGVRKISDRPLEIREEGQISASCHGGTLRGVLANIEHIKALGANTIYLNPIFYAASPHKYDTIDYKKIDPCFGSLDDLKELVEACHREGIRVILDGVFNHCGSGWFAFQDVLKNQKMSPYWDWFYRLKEPVTFQDPPTYECFAYVKEMPKLNTGNPDVRRYFCDVGRYWIRVADIDGWRLDVANEIDHDFWRAFRKAVREEKEDAFLIGEIWEDSEAWLRGDQMDSTMNYQFADIARDFFAEGKITLKEFADRVSRMYFRYREPVAEVQMNFLDTHDVPRFLSYCKQDKKKLVFAMAFMMTFAGIPSIFYGDEYGVFGETESEYRKPMPWTGGDEEVYAAYRYWIHERREHPALSHGRFRILEVDEEKGILRFLRYIPENRELDMEVILDCKNLKCMVNEITR